jgi:hypothetical protein
MRLVFPFLLASLVVGCDRDQPATPKGSPPKEEAVVVFRAAMAEPSRWLTCNC